MEARSAATPAEALTGATDLDASPVAGLERSGSAVASRRRPVARPKVLSREQEYGYIREDMRRLIIIAAVLLVVMIALLFVLD